MYVPGKLVILSSIFDFSPKILENGISSLNRMTCLISSTLIRMIWSRDDHVVRAWSEIEPEVDRSLQKLSDTDRNIFTHNYLYVTISSFNIIF